MDKHHNAVVWIVCAVWKIVCNVFSQHAKVPFNTYMTLYENVLFVKTFISHLFFLTQIGADQIQTHGHCSIIYIPQKP